MKRTKRKYTRKVSPEVAPDAVQSISGGDRTMRDKGVDLDNWQKHRA